MKCQTSFSTYYTSVACVCSMYYKCVLDMLEVCVQSCQNSLEDEHTHLRTQYI
jgi:hypothetical protein